MSLRIVMIMARMMGLLQFRSMARCVGNLIDEYFLKESSWRCAAKVDLGIRMRWFVPVTGWRRLFLSRYTKAKVYRLLGIPVWVRLYTSEGLPLTFCRAWEHVRTRLGM